jgi:WhiB family redox-sensing transcriptional regulator
MREEDWKAQANCLGTDTEMFFVENESQSYPPQLKRICGVCDVKAECLEYALENKIDFGYWAGTTSVQRRRMTNRLRNR